MIRVLRYNPWLTGASFLFITCWVINFYWGILASFLGFGGLVAIFILTALYSEIYMSIKIKKWDIALLLYYFSLFLIIIIFYIVSGSIGEKQIGYLVIMPLALFIIFNLVDWLKG